MSCHHQCSLHHIYANWVNNDNIHESLEIISSDKYLVIVKCGKGKKWETSL